MTKILIVDDEEIARITLADILLLEGYAIFTLSPWNLGITLT
jgi:CheY-like chemotaxis protein